MFFGGQNRRRNGPRQGADLRYDIEITLEDAAFGLQKEIEFLGYDPCKTCKVKPHNCPYGEKKK